MARVLIIGCGQLGSRHLQAIASLPEVHAIEVVDPKPEALALGKERLQELADHSVPARVRWFSSLEQASRGGDLCIEATQAVGRCDRIREVVKNLGYSCFLLEKLVAQSVSQMEGLLEFSKNRGLSIWVNLKSRAYPFHQRVKRLLDPDEPIVLSAVGGNHGLANNGIHTTDLFVFYDGASRIDGGGSWIRPGLHPSKRGKELFDLSGLLSGHTAKGSSLSISFAGDHEQSDQLFLSTRRYRCIVDHLQRWAVESDASSGWAWRSVPFEGNLLVSEMTKIFAREILSGGRCELPTLEESMAAHRFILDSLRPHFSRLLQKEVELCPVT